MTIFDLLFLLCALSALATLIVAAVTRSLKTLTKLAMSVVVYIVMVYSATLFSKPIVTPTGAPQCSDDWCIAVDAVNRNGADYVVKLRVLSEAKRIMQSEAAAKDVYLVNEQWNRYDPSPQPDDIPLTVRLGPGESVSTTRHFNVPPSAHITGLKVAYKPTPYTLCLVIGECDAFHKGRMIALP